MAMTRTWTAEELELMPPDNYRYELIEGALQRMAAAGGRHGEVAHEAGRRIGNHVAERRLGRVYSSDTGFILDRNPDIVFMPDVAFVRTDRLPPEDERVGFMSVAPDLVVEVVSPSDSSAYLREKVERSLRAGVGAVWIFDSRRRAVLVHRANQAVEELDGNDVLDGGGVLPGSHVPVADFFA